MSRILAREYCFKLIFEQQFLLEKDVAYIEEIMQDDKLSDDDKNYINKSYNNITEKQFQIDELIRKYLEGYTLERLYKIDLSILRVAVYELVFSDEKLPNSVIIDAAVELAKKYSTDNSYKFINGILASIVRGDNNAKATN